MWQNVRCEYFCKVVPCLFKILTFPTSQCINMLLSTIFCISTRKAKRGLPSKSRPKERYFERLYSITALLLYPIDHKQIHCHKAALTMRSMLRENFTGLPILPFFPCTPGIPCKGDRNQSMKAARGNNDKFTHDKNNNTCFFQIQRQILLLLSVIWSLFTSAKVKKKMRQGHMNPFVLIQWFDGVDLIYSWVSINLYPSSTLKNYPPLYVGCGVRVRSKHYLKISSLVKICLKCLISATMKCISISSFGPWTATMQPCRQDAHSH